MAKKQEEIEAFLKAFVECRGNVVQSCEKSGFARRTYYDYHDKEHDSYNPEFVERCKIARQKIIEIAQSKMWQLAEGFDYEETREESSETPMGYTSKKVIISKQARPDFRAIEHILNKNENKGESNNFTFHFNYIEPTDDSD